MGGQEEAAGGLHAHRSALRVVMAALDAGHLRRHTCRRYVNSSGGSVQEPFMRSESLRSDWDVSL